MDHMITTYSGFRFDPLAPDPELIRIGDIAHALSLLCRGNGHVQRFWSVAQHCICCAREAHARGLGDRMTLICLLHDSGECFLSDVPSPLKDSLAGYQEIESRLMDVIYVRFLGSKLTGEEHRMMKELDRAFLWYDLEYLLRDHQQTPAPVLMCPPDHVVRTFGEVEQEYLRIFYRHYGKLRGGQEAAGGTEAGGACRATGGDEVDP